MKGKIKAYSIPLKYFQRICHKFNKCQQGTNSVRFYKFELRDYHCCVNISKDDEDTISRFIKGLRADIKE